jgi:ribosomal protein S6--L-glutamate ligase
MKKYFDEIDDVRIKNIEVVMNGKVMEVLYEGKPLPHYDCIYAKGSFRYASVLRALTSVLCEETYFPLTPNSFTLGHDKLLTHLELQRHRIPTPRTYIVASKGDIVKEVLQQVSYPIVMKLPTGTQGKGVMFADSASSASSMLDTLLTLKQPFLIQEYIETGGVDIRAFVVGENVIACMKRKAVEGEKRANIHVGGKGEAYVASHQVKKLAVDTAKAVGAEICAVDILEGAKGHLVIEVNISPGLQGITAATKLDVASKIAKYLSDRTEKLMSSKKKTGAEKILQELGIDEEQGKPLITTLDVRSGRLLLPELVTSSTGFDDKTDVIIESKKDELRIKKFK